MKRQKDIAGMQSVSAEQLVLDDASNFLGSHVQLFNTCFVFRKANTEESRADDKPLTMLTEFLSRARFVNFILLLFSHQLFLSGGSRMHQTWEVTFSENSNTPAGPKPCRRWNHALSASVSLSCGRNQQDS